MLSINYSSLRDHTQNAEWRALKTPTSDFIAGDVMAAHSWHRETTA